jgi:hypothetical protein
LFIIYYYSLFMVCYTFIIYHALFSIYYYSYSYFICYYLLFTNYLSFIMYYYVLFTIYCLLSIIYYNMLYIEMYIKSGILSTLFWHSKSVLSFHLGSNKSQPLGLATRSQST